MNPRLTGLVAAAVALLVLALVPSAGAIQRSPGPNCTTATLKTVKRGNNRAKPEAWFTRRLRRSGCLKRGNPTPPFKPFSSHCRKKTGKLDGYISRLGESFTARLEQLMLANQPRLLQLDSRELTLLRQRQSANREIRTTAGPDRRRVLRRQVRRIDSQLLTVRTKRARINYRMNTKAITRSGAAGIWLSMFDGEVSGCSRPFRTSPYQVSMRGNLALLLAANQLVTPVPTRSSLKPWNEILSITARL